MKRSPILNIAAVAALALTASASYKLGEHNTTKEYQKKEAEISRAVSTAKEAQAITLSQAAPVQTQQSVQDQVLQKFRQATPPSAPRGLRVSSGN